MRRKSEAESAETGRKRRRGTIPIALGLVCILGAGGLTAWNVWDAYRAEQASGAVLEAWKAAVEASADETQESPSDSVSAAEDAAEEEGDKSLSGEAVLRPLSEADYPDYVLDPEMDMPEIEIDGETYIALLEIPDLDLSLPVCGSWSYSNLRVAPCRYSGSAYLDNLVICAHNYTSHFANIRYLSAGSPVYLTDADGNTFTYTVTQVEILEPTAIDEMITGDDWDLTLFTCTTGGQARVAVRCTRQADYSYLAG